MAYLEEFSIHIANDDLSRFLQLWEEYCASDQVEAEEYLALLEKIEESDLAPKAGPYIEAGLPLWSKIEDDLLSCEILKKLIDLQTSNSDLLAETADNFLKAKYGDHKYFGSKVRLIGLRDRKNFQRAISNFDLLTHMDKDKFVYHTAGWGTGEIIEISLIREELIIEFENVLGNKSLTFENAFRTLEPLDEEHFLAQRFSNADALEAKAKNTPVEVVKSYLKDMGPKTAGEIKEDFLELVIPQDDWSKWWQTTRAKLKKDTYIIPPANVKEPFKLRTAEVTHEQQLAQALANDKSAPFQQMLTTSYNFVRDTPDVLKNTDLRDEIVNRFTEFVLSEQPTLAQRLQASIFLESFCQSPVSGQTVQTVIQQVQDPRTTLDEIPIVAFKKRTLTAIKDHRHDWVPLFLDLVFVAQPSTLRDYVLKELQGKETIQALEETILDLVSQPQKHPEAFVWYFQKVAAGKSVLFSDSISVGRFFEAFLTLYHIIENDPEHRELIKKMYNLMSGKRWKLMRDILEGSSLTFCKEIVLLASKCQSLSGHDMKIIRSLAQVVHPELGGEKSPSQSEQNIVWTTQEGLAKTQERVRQIGEDEMVDNAKEIEVARAHGDLRENAEYKSALERRDRLQAELKLLSDQLQNARVLTPVDLDLNQVSVGTQISLENSKGEKIQYSILGPWDADPDNHILSFQSLLAKAAIGTKQGEKFSFKDEEFTVLSIESALTENGAQISR